MVQYIIVNNLINENIFLLKIRSFKTGWVIFEDSQFMLNHTFHIQNTCLN